MPRRIRHNDLRASRHFATNDDSEQLEPHRAYGVKKRVTVFTRLNDILAVALALMLFALCGSILFMGTFWLIALLGHIGIALSVLAGLAIIYFWGLRVFRKRLKFIFKLKRKCKSLGFKVKFLRGFFKGLKRNKEGFDFTVDTGKICYCVRYFTTFKYLSHLIFADKDTLQIRKNITKSRFKFIFGLNTPKLTQIKYSFDDKMTVYNRKTKKVLLLNPVPHECFKKYLDGAIIPIGSGEPIQDYVIYSGSSFINTLVRLSQE